MSGSIWLGVVGVLAGAGTAFGTVYTDTVGDEFTGNAILDIVQLEVTNDFNDINFSFTLNGDIDATDWGKYMVIIDSVAGGDTAGNGWGRPISMTSGADYWIGSWVDAGSGAELYSFSGGWGLQEATYNAAPDNDVSIVDGGSVVTITVPLAAMNLSVGQTIEFDAFSSGGGGGDAAIDSLGNPNQQVGDWGESSEATNLRYTLVPTPGAVALVGIGGLAVAGRRRR